jgi:hypothetical protein
MKFSVDDRILKLVNGPIYWFSESKESRKLVRDNVPNELKGIYCLWWKDPKTLPESPRIELDAGRRGKQLRELKLHVHGLNNAAAMYVGKGSVCSRLFSHLKPAGKSGRNPRWWISQIVTELDTDAAIKMHLGFSFIEEPNSWEQIYAENLAIGILRPWFNLRCTA